MKQRWRAPLAVVAATAACAGARADDGDGFNIRAPDLSLSAQPEPAQTEPDSSAAKPPADPSHGFGTPGQAWITVGGGVADNFTDAVDTNIRVAYSVFLIKDVEFSWELNGWYFNQPGDNAYGINPAMNFRWHFYNEDPWSVYADVGIGLLFASDNVPDGGTGFNFTPKAGVGFTHRLGDDGARLQVGVRWHHVSNARIFGDENNPSRDGLMVYAGIQWPL